MSFSRATALEDLLLWPEVIGSAHWLVVGTPTDAVAAIKDWAKAGAIDGCVAFPGGSTKVGRLFLEQVVPALSDFGRFRKDYRGITFIDHPSDR
ncbi:hypothetical protein [Roseibium sp. M-1]